MADGFFGKLNRFFDHLCREWAPLMRARDDDDDDYNFASGRRRGAAEAH